MLILNGHLYLIGVTSCVDLRTDAKRHVLDVFLNYVLRNLLTILGLVGNIIRAHMIIYGKRIFTSLMNRDIHMSSKQHGGNDNGHNCVPISYEKWMQS